MNYSSYYQAHVVPATCWYVTAILRSSEHVCFDRALDPAAGMIEFFVPEAMEQIFLSNIQYFIDRNLVSDLKKLPNRFA